MIIKYIYVSPYAVELLDTDGTVQVQLKHYDSIVARIGFNIDGTRNFTRFAYSYIDAYGNTKTKSRTTEKYINEFKTRWL